MGLELILTEILFDQNLNLLGIQFRRLQTSKGITSRPVSVAQENSDTGQRPTKA